MKPLEIPSALFDDMLAEAVRRYPSEACGFLLGRAGEIRQAVTFVPCRNIQDDLHAADPERYPRTAATAYAIDSKELAGVEKRASDAGLNIVAIVHSHPDHDAYFSDEDKANAAPWGEPLFPDASYVVMSVFGGAVRDVNEFYWDDGKKDFIARNLIASSF